MRNLVSRGDLSQKEAEAVLRAAVESMAPRVEGQETARRFEQLDNISLSDELIKSAGDLGAVSMDNFKVQEQLFDDISDDEFDQAIADSLSQAGTDES